MSTEAVDLNPGVNLEAKFTADPVDWKVYNDRWDQLWAHGVGPGQRWDTGKSSPALVNFLHSGKVDLKGKRALVPGCGRGYDVVAFAKAGVAKALGLELSPVAAKEANTWVQSTLQQGSSSASASVQEADFFTFQDPEGPFDLGYDYTFGCAMHPTMRKQWAESWAGVICPGGSLIALVFPIDPLADPNVGPPFHVTPELYKQLLEPAGFECISLEPVPAELSLPSRQGKEYLGHWRRI